MSRRREHNGSIIVTNKVRIAVLDDYQGAALRYADWSALSDRADMTVFRDHLHDPDAVVERLAPFDVVCLMRERTPLTAAMLDRLPRLRLIVTTAMWNASIDCARALARGIVVSGTQSIQSGTPELIWLLILSLARRYDAERGSLRDGGWQTSVGVDLWKRTLGVMGLGQIGLRTAKVGNAFGMRVIAWSQNLTPKRAAEAGAEYVDKDALLAQSDFLTINLRCSERTRHIVGAAELRRMKPSAYLVNTSRGPLVDEAALIAALRERRIGGAALDVFDIEPLPPDHPFRHMDNVVATPHIGYVTDAAFRLFYPQIVENIDAWLKGAPIRRLDVQAPT